MGGAWVSPCLGPLKNPKRKMWRKGFWLGFDGSLYEGLEGWLGLGLALAQVHCKIQEAKQMEKRLLLGFDGSLYEGLEGWLDLLPAWVRLG